MILDKIIKKKKEEVKKNKRNLPLDRFKSKLKLSDRNFKKSVSKGFNLIAEIILCQTVKLESIAIIIKT